jgi:hypothetical protein
MVLYGSLALREEHRLMVFENKVLGEYLDRREMKRQEGGENCIMRSFIACTLLQV